MTLLVDVTSPAVQQVLPDDRQVSVRDLVAQVRAAPAPAPFADEVMDFCGSLAGRLRRRARGTPEVQALAYWMRPAEVRRLAAEFTALEDDRTILVPRGTVFHLPPANVDTIFIYSWILSTLVGNRNIVRLPRRAGEQAALITEVVGDLLADGGHPTVRDTTAMVRYEPTRGITDALSAGCDLRVVWGGDATVDEVRHSPLPPRATDVTFPDRFSLAALDVAGYLSLTEPGRTQLVERFFNDAYPFDQLGCSSPRLVVWVGDEAATARAAADFFDRLAQATRRHEYRVDAATAISKLSYAHRAVIDREIAAARNYSEQVTVLSLDTFADVRGAFCGAGLFFQLRLDSLTDLARYLEPRDQTLAQFGFDREELVRFVREVNGRGLDRIVPIGEALTFDRVWDGYDLIQSFTRRTTVDVSQVHLT